VKITALLGLLGPLSIALMLAVIGLLSRRLGRATGAAPYYLGFFAASLMVAISVAARIINLYRPDEALERVYTDPLWILLYTGLPALGVTVGVILAWRYWSWLLAERD
jgi:hypothetical protein